MDKKTGDEEKPLGGGRGREVLSFIPGAVPDNLGGPANMVFRDGRPAAMIDFDTAAPCPRLLDLGQSAWEWLDLGADARPLSRCHGRAGPS